MDVAVGYGQVISTKVTQSKKNTSDLWVGVVKFLTHKGANLTYVNRNNSNICWYRGVFLHIDYMRRKRHVTNTSIAGKKTADTSPWKYQMDNTLKFDNVRSGTVKRTKSMKKRHEEFAFALWEPRRTFNKRQKTKKLCKSKKEQRKPESESMEDIIMQFSSSNGTVSESDANSTLSQAANVFIGRNTDGNFLAKLGDFGMVRFEVEQFSKTRVSSTKGFVEGTVAYIAPELLQCGAKQNYKTDVYSFSMLMVEFTLPERSHPWEGEVATSDLILHFVKQEKRPNIEDSDLNPSEEGKVEWFKLIQDCWNQNPELRPTANTIYSKLSEIVGRNSLAHLSTHLSLAKMNPL
ncbi:hypothetical protein QZH41_005047 [Actinostola sp. cb2023]|nr:hypothetical protein QZH41_005047 [Actinostola sp. cb2023]